MKQWMILLLMVVAFALAGCQSAAFQSGDQTGQGLKAEYATTARPGYLIITHRDGRVEIIPLSVRKEVLCEK